MKMRYGVVRPALVSGEHNGVMGGGSTRFQLEPKKGSKMAHSPPAELSIFRRIMKI
jgi:hypothetical protein